MRRNKEQWQALMAEQQSSGLSAVDYCRQYGINPKYFSARKTQLQRERDGGSFVQVSTASTAEPIAPSVITKAAANKQSRIRVIDIELGDVLDARSLGLMLNQVLS